MTQFLSQMMKLPLAIFVYSLEMLTKTMQGMRSMADQGIDTIVREVDQTLRGTVSSESALVGHVTDDPARHRIKAISQIPQREDRNMPDLDLGGDDLKLVSYSILFDKPDEEKILQEKKQELVDYATDGGSYGGLKIGDFFRDNALATTIAPKDRRYVKFDYQVDRRLPKGAPNYEKRKVELLKEISDKIA